MRIYHSNQRAHQMEEPVENLIEEVSIEAPVPAGEAPQTEGMWKRCPTCAAVLYADDLANNMYVCTSCGHHFRMTARQRIECSADEGTFIELNEGLIGKNPLNFPNYEEKLEKLREKTGINEGIITGECEIGGQKCVIAVMDGFFVMGSMSAAVGEKFVCAAELALQKNLPLIAFTVSGGARMQEGLVSLMQMGKTAAVLARMDDKKLPYFVVLTDPTTGGVTASFAMLGDITIAEPNAIIGFAGRRVIEQTVKQVLPPTFQKAEFLLDRGFVDSIVERKNMKKTLETLLKMHKGGNLR